MNPRSALVVLRIYLGVIFAFAVWPKLRLGVAFPHQLAGFLTAVGLQNAHPFYQTFLTAVVIPHVTVFAFLVMLGECFVALAMLTGTVTRLAGVVAMFLVTNYMFAKGLWWWNPSSNDSAFFFISLAMIIGAAGRSCGVDVYLARRWPRSVLW